MHKMTDTSFIFIIVAILAILRIGGKALLDLKEAFKEVAWLGIVLLAGIMMIATALGEPTTGITGFVTGIITPLTEGLSPFVVVLILAVASVVLTNIANNVPVGIIFVSVGVPLCFTMGINPVIVAITVAISANMSFTIPPSFVPVGFAYADPYCEGKTVLKNGIFVALLACVVCGLLIYPLATLFT